MGDFQKLKVWKRAKNLAVSIYKSTEKGPFLKGYGLKDQIRRSAVSISSNIAEGDDLKSVILQSLNSMRSKRNAWLFPVCSQSLSK